MLSTDHTCALLDQDFHCQIRLLIASKRMRRALCRQRSDNA